MFVGVFILLIGILMLLERSGIIRGDFGEFLVPVLLIAFGVSMVFKRNKFIK